MNDQNVFATNSSKKSSINLALCAAGEIYGGVEEWVYTFACCVRQSNPDLRLTVVLFYDAQLAAKLRLADVDVVIARFEKYDFRAITFLKKLFIERAISVVHVHGYRAMVSCGFAAVAAGIPLVKTEHSVLEPAGSLAAVVRHSRMYFNLGLDRLLTILCARQITYVSQFAAVHYKSFYWMKHSRVIHNGIVLDAEGKAPVDVVFDSACIHLGIVGRLSPVKGHRFLFDAICHLKNRPYFASLRVHVFGNGSLEHELRGYCKAHGIDSIVHFHGFKDNVRQYYPYLTCLVMPSIFESMPYTLLESMDAGVPAIAARVGGIPEVVTDGVNGVLVEPQSPEAIAAAIGRLHAQRADFVRMGERAKKTIAERFSIAGMVRGYVELYTAMND